MLSRGSAVRAGASCIAVSLALLVTAAPSAGAPRITGKVSEPGYTVIAVAANGKARSVVARQGRFRLRPPTRNVSLHLRAADGRYAGPVVIRRQGRRAILGLKAGARLGRIEVQPGYARLVRRLPRRWIDATRKARARKGVPIGARVFGRVRSKPPRRSVPGDRDLDGVPNPLDIDDDGDRVLDNLERSNTARASRAAARQEFAFEFNLPAAIFETANANAAGLTLVQTDALLSRRGSLGFDVLPGDSELDCGSPQSRTDPLLGGLSYCSKGGTGRLAIPGSNVDAGPFPDCCDADGDGFGRLNPNRLLMPRATSAQIGTGDVLIQRVTAGGAETDYAATLQYVFATVPALISYSDGQGNSATVQYPVPTANCGSPPCPAPGPGTFENPFPVKAGPRGDIVLTLTVWRPQRRSIPPETGEWTDIGGLVYEVEGGNFGRDCPQKAYSTADKDLAPAPLLPAPQGEDETGGLRDLAPDRPANRANVLTMGVNLSACLRARRLEFPQPEPWNQGETKVFSLRGTDRLSYAAQLLAFKRQ